MKTNIFIILLLLMFTRNHQAQELSVLRDKFAFKTAAEMYAVADTLPFDTYAADLIRQIDGAIADSAVIEHPDVWRRLVKLEPYRKTPEVQQALARWVKTCQIMQIGSETDLQSSDYLKGNWGAFIQRSRFHLFNSDIKGDDKYKKSIRFRQNEFLIRNNLALALMHQNLDLCAQTELEIVFSANESSLMGIPDWNMGYRSVNASTTSVPLDSIKRFISVYLPAMINLTVVYERLGMTEKAALLAQKTQEYSDLEPLTNFNAAWYYDTPTGKASGISLHALQKVEDEKYQLMARKMNRDLPWYRVGLVRKTGLFNRFGNTAGFIALLIFSLAIWYFYYRLLVKNYSRLPRFDIGEYFGCLLALAIGGSILIAMLFENGGILIAILLGILVTIVLYPAVANLLWSYFLFWLLMGGSNVRGGNDPGLVLYLIVSFIAGIIIMLLASKERFRIR
jgi:hypothetical protein